MPPIPKRQRPEPKPEPESVKAVMPRPAPMPLPTVRLPAKPATVGPSGQPVPDRAVDAAVGRANAIPTVPAKRPTVRPKGVRVGPVRPIPATDGPTAHPAYDRAVQSTLDGLDGIPEGLREPKRVELWHRAYEAAVSDGVTGYDLDRIRGRFQTLDHAYFERFKARWTGRPQPGVRIRVIIR